MNSYNAPFYYGKELFDCCKDKNQFETIFKIKNLNHLKKILE